MQVPGLITYLSFTNNELIHIVGPTQNHNIKLYSKIHQLIIIANKVVCN